MSGPQTHAHDGAAHGGHGHDEHSHGTFRSYMTGFILSVILTAIPFWIVMGDVFESRQLAGFVIVGFAVVQILVHMVYFLHMDTTSEQGWTMMALIFTIIVVVIAISGSLWVMFHLNANTMPFHEMQQLP